MNIKKTVLQISLAAAFLGLTSCVVAPVPYYGRSVVRRSFGAPAPYYARPVVRPSGFYGPNIYTTVPVGYTGSYYSYGGRYYTGGRYETGRYYVGGRYYPHRYSHGGRYIYGGRHRYR